MKYTHMADSLNKLHLSLDILCSYKLWGLLLKLPVCTLPQRARTYRATDR